ncbi:cytochrome-c peroxidase [Pyxidicoccus trucidator]|uniref:cytochrome-c peroxidase n=1 Tax=Pyxidicoccus trucidator TaxID=2709662 RepID=UPI0013DC2346|nr:cytochrome c peroxidase [Pyxidicoccus trucidator]
MRVSLGLLLICACGGAGSPEEEPTPPPNPGPCAIDARLSSEQCQRARAMRLPDSLPPARGNAVADSEAAARLGQRLFFATSISSSFTVACFGCHLPEEEFDDGRAHPETPPGSATDSLGRNSPSLLNAAWMRTQLWDGRADTLWSQPLFAIENPAEMATTRLELSHRVVNGMGQDYAAVFGERPSLPFERFPPVGGPGDATFDGMRPEDRATVNRLAANVGKAIEAYLRRLAAGPSPFDRFLGGEETALSSEAREGLYVFFRAGCDGCHSGPMLSDEGFHNLGVPSAEDKELDPGRERGWSILVANPFNTQGPYFDGLRPLPGWEVGPGLQGAFRTPPLRNLLASAPYGHNGRFATLEEVVDFHLIAARAPGRYLGEVSPLLRPVTLEPAERSALHAFLRSLEGVRAGPPWNGFP